MENNNQTLRKDRLLSQLTASDRHAGTEPGGSTGTMTATSPGPVGASETAQPGTSGTEDSQEVKTQELVTLLDNYKEESQKLMELVASQNAKMRDAQDTSLQYRQTLEQTLEKRTKDKVELRKKIKALQIKVLHYETSDTHAERAHIQGLKMRIEALEDHLEGAKNDLAAHRALR